MSIRKHERSSASALGAAALLGVATGMRSTAGVGVLVLHGGPRGSSSLPGPFGTGAAKPAAVLAMGAEIVLDKLPITSSRLDPPGLIGRVSFAALGGVLVARGSRLGPVPAALVAVAAALASAKAFHDLRALADRRVPDPAVAVAEDLLSLEYANLAATR